MAKKKPFSTDPKKVNGPEEGKPWVFHNAELRDSPSWRYRSEYCARFLDFLEREHMAHAGKENGRLKAPYKQLQADKFIDASGVERNGARIPRGCIPAVIEEAEALKLIEVRRGGKKNLVENHESAYRLTYFFTRSRDEKGTVLNYAATHDWKHIPEDAAKAIKTEMQQRRRVGKRGKAAISKTASRYPHGVPSRNPMGGTQSVQNTDSSVPHGGTAYNILGGDGSSNSLPPSQRGAGRNQPSLSTDGGDGEPGRGSPQHAERPGSTMPRSKSDSVRSRPGGSTANLNPAEPSLFGDLPAMPSPAQELRDLLAGKIATAPRGWPTRVASQIGVSRSHLLNFRSGADDLSPAKLDALRAYLTEAAA